MDQTALLPNSCGPCANWAFCGFKLLIFPACKNKDLAVNFVKVLSKTFLARDSMATIAL